MDAPRVVVAGGSGFLGRLLCDRLAAQGHEVIVLTRQPTPAGNHATHVGVRLVHWTPDGAAGEWASQLDGAHLVVNLAGESIAAHRWSSSQKQRLVHSRLDATRSLVEAFRVVTVPPR